MHETEYLERLRTYLKIAETSKLRLHTLAVQHLADGVTVAQDRQGEYDTYFDRNNWEPTMPELWGDTLYPPHLRSFNLGVLPGIGKLPSVRNFKEAVPYAMSQLKPKNGKIWHNPIPEIQKVP